VNRVYDSKARRYAEDNSTERTGKSEAEVNNNLKKKLCSRYCTTEANYTDRHEASRGFFATAELLVSWRICSKICIL